MLSRKDLSTYRTVTGFTLGQIEKDYLQHIILSVLYRVIQDELVFKGGTALQKTFGLNRFSEDLDFTMIHTFPIGPVLQQLLQGLKRFGCDATQRKKKEEMHGQTYVIKIKGPLFTGADHSLASVRLEISKRESVILPVKSSSITPVYQDLPAYSVAVMDPSEIMAEKVRAVFTRNKARDVYDLWFLMQKQQRTTVQLINEKLQYYNMAYSDSQLEQALRQKEKIWDHEMSQLISLHIDYQEILQSLTPQHFID
jgi:predicted nucleotidyltransferase component of viral defense system